MKKFRKTQRQSLPPSLHPLQNGFETYPRRSLACCIQCKRRRSCFMSSEGGENVIADQAEERTDGRTGEHVAEEMHSEDDARGRDQKATASRTPVRSG